MDTDDYQKKLRELGINRGKLETGFVEKDAEPEDAPKLSGRPSAPPENIEKSTLSTGSKVSVKLTNFSDKRVVNNPVNKCRCGVTISDAAKRCRKCFREDMRKTWKAAEQGISLPPAPSPPVAIRPREEEEPLPEVHTLFLDVRKERRVVVMAPVHVTARELRRIQAWLSLQLIVEEPGDWDYVI